jgi:APA family basic amino acid/polyamine antiporter
VLVLRRETVDHEHFHAPSVFPVLGAVVAVALIVDTALDDIAVFARAAILLAVGLVLWFANRLIAGPPEEVEAEALRG